ncbi:hypothetical protein C0J52_12624 [Blattella germanica]|nr:hypothetical protein C0J52_12624 [Blattella germanica]
MYMFLVLLILSMSQTCLSVWGETYGCDHGRCWVRNGHYARKTGIGSWCWSVREPGSLTIEMCTDYTVCGENWTCIE